MSFEIIQGEEVKEANQEQRKRKLHRCIERCINLKDKKILVAVHGIFLFSLGVVLTVGHFAIKATTTSTVHVATSIPTVVNSIMAVLSGILFTLLVFKKQRWLIITTIILSTATGILSAIGAVHYGITVSDRLSALSDCKYTNIKRLCTCSVVTSSSRVEYDFDDTMSCAIITKHLREVAYGMCGVYAVTFVCCFGAAVHAILLAHRIAIKKIKILQKQEECVSSKKYPTEKRPLEDCGGVGKSEKRALPSQQDVATQTTSRGTGNDASCRHQCRHFVEVTVPDANNDFVVNITKSRDPPPPYCETVYT